MSKSIDLVLHEGAAAVPVLQGKGKLTEGATYILTVRAVKVSAGYMVLYPAVNDFAPSGHLRVALTPLG